MALSRPGPNATPEEIQGHGVGLSFPKAALTFCGQSLGQQREGLMECQRLLFKGEDGMAGAQALSPPGAPVTRSSWIASNALGHETAKGWWGGQGAEQKPQGRPLSSEL